MMDNNFFGNTDIGKQRQNNEDEFIAQKTTDQALIIGCVIDGVGGYLGGEIAAAIARESIISHLSAIGSDVIPAMKTAFGIANKQIFEEKVRDNELRNMACVLTLVVADVDSNQFYYAHVGDTRLYLLRDDTLVKISKDDSFVGFLEDSGKLTEEAAMNHPKRNEINKALGFEEQIEKKDDFIETGQSPFLPGDLLLICSDGLTDMLNKDEITSILLTETSLKEKGNKLIDAANEHGGKDNVTVVLIKNEKAPTLYDATRPLTNGNTKEIENIQDKTDHEETSISDKNHPKGRSNWALIILALLCLVFLGTSVWQYFNPRSVPVTPVVKTVPPTEKARNAQEIKLQDTLNKLKGNTLILSASEFKEPIVISDTLHIQRDTLYLRTNGGIILKRDSAYTGPALTLSSKCKHIVLDSLVFEGFVTAIQVNNSALTLKNTRFINCGQPLQMQFKFPNKKYMNGKLPSVIFNADSLPKHTH
jgi:serine/threonine protein phosphatase PrpC